MTTSPTLLPFLFLAACIPTSMGSWSGSPPPAPPPPPPAASAFDNDDHGDRDERDDRDGRDDRDDDDRDVRGGGGGGSSGGSAGDPDFPQPTSRQLKELAETLDDLPSGDRIKQFGSLIDPFYFTVEQLAVLVEELPSFDRVKAIDIAACSVRDPENAGRIKDAVVVSDKAKAISALKKQCYRKNSWDKRPPGKMSPKAAPPPGAYLLPSER